jgi:U3 small nucleolar ribonucleoprotein protein IMP4
MVVCHLPYGPTAYFGVFNTVLRHDIGQKKEVGTISEAYPHLIFEKFTSPLGQRLANILKHLFPVPKDDSKRLVTFANADDYVSFRHHIYSTPRGSSSIELTEVSRWACTLVWDWVCKQLRPRYCCHHTPAFAWIV